MQEAKLHGLFPTPVLFTNIDREFTENEKIFIMEHSKKTVSNAGNITSSDNYILKNKAMAVIDYEIQSAFNQYMTEVVKPSRNVKVYATQSWLNYTKPGEYHHRHEHPNSYLSAVLYVNADGKKDKIHFYDSGYKQIKLQSKEFTWYNSGSWWFEVKSGDIVVFPSHLTHMVEQTQSEDTRISLAVNSFLKGEIGDNGELTELLLV